jgi:hypothetical protein
MSYYTTLQVSVFDPEQFDVESVATAIREHLDRYGISHDVLDDIRTAFASGEAHVKVHGAYVVSLLDWIHQHAPGLDFCARGWGEEPDDLWIRSYRKNGRSLAAGPFDLSAPASSSGALSSEWLTRSTTTDGRRVLVRPGYAKWLVGVLVAAIIIIVLSYIGSHL